MSNKAIIVTESKAWEMLAERYMELDKEHLVDQIIGFMQAFGDGSGQLSLKGLALELQNEFEQEYIVVEDNNATKVLF